VLIMEDVKNEKNKTELRFLPEMLHIDCGTVTVNTECRVEIPPRDSPFRWSGIEIDYFYESTANLAKKLISRYYVHCI
jgi:hypothetical protein